MRLRKKESAVQDIDISPLIDMVFILLIFFMVSTTFVKDMQLEIDRPQASTQTAASTKAIRVYIDNTGDVYLNGEAVSTWVLQGLLKDQLRASSQKSVLVVTDSKVPAGQLVEVVDQCKLAGAKDVGVATQIEAGGITG